MMHQGLVVRSVVIGPRLILVPHNQLIRLFLLANVLFCSVF
jgi:hypothetical protein